MVRPDQSWAGVLHGSFTLAERLRRLAAQGKELPGMQFRYAPRGYFPVLRAQNFEKTGLERIKIEADGRSHLKPAFVAGRPVLTSLFLPRLLGSNLLVKEAHAANSADG
jgi:hypothetical protein